MPPKPKRTSQTRTRSSAKRARVTELIETRPGPSAQQQAAASTEQPLMTVNMQALSASVSNAVQQAVAEAIISFTLTYVFLWDCLPRVKFLKLVVPPWSGSLCTDLTHPEFFTFFTIFFLLHVPKNNAAQI